jgi:hypothetical protein
MSAAHKLEVKSCVTLVNNVCKQQFLPFQHFESSIRYCTIKYHISRLNGVSLLIIKKHNCTKLKLCL